MNVKSCIVVAFAAALSGCSQTATKDVTPSTPAYALTQTDTETVQAGVRASLKDPASATFGPMSATQRADGVITVCGYVGTAPFMGVLTLAPKPVFDVTGVGSDDEKAALTTTFCQKAGIVLAAQ